MWDFVTSWGGHTRTGDSSGSFCGNQVRDDDGLGPGSGGGQKEAHRLERDFRGGRAGIWKWAEAEGEAETDPGFCA